jgi:hypothetical protein
MCWARGTHLALKLSKVGTLFSLLRAPETLSRLLLLVLYSHPDAFTLVATAAVPNASYTHVRYALIDYPQCVVVDSQGMPLAPFVRELECSFRSGATECIHLPVAMKSPLI